MLYARTRSAERQDHLQLWTTLVPIWGWKGEKREVLCTYGGFPQNPLTRCGNGSKLPSTESDPVNRLRRGKPAGESGA